MNIIESKDSNENLLDENTCLSIGLDLGGDTLKIAFAYHEGKEVKYGKFANTSKFTQIALPALAFYDEQNKKWLYADQIGGQNESFITVVKIKSLISLLKMNDEQNVWEKNKEYYYSGYDFPKFYFPVQRKMLDNFEEMVNADRTFKSHQTPKQVCQGFFDYVKALIDLRTQELSKRTKIDFSGLKIAFVHASSVGEDYIEEVCALIKNSFGFAPNKVLSANKALAINAMRRTKSRAKKNNDFLVFDMGEEEISVVRAGMTGGNIVIDGVEGHNAPASIGGIDIDRAIVNHLEKSVYNRETMGCPSSGEEGHISEGAVYGKQYLLMQDIKKAKVIFSKPLREDSIFQTGVPITLSYDLYIQRRLTKEEIKKCIGVEKSTGIALKIANYITSEITRPINQDVKKIYISGGLTETYSLLDYIVQKVSEEAPDVEVCTFDDYCCDGDGFKILSYEDSVFAPAVGGAIVALENIKINMVTSLSYATWAYNSNAEKYLAIFVNRGEKIGEGQEFFERFNSSGIGIPLGEEMLSTHFTDKDIEARKLSSKLYYDAEGRLLIGAPGSKERKACENNIGLITVSGGARGRIYFKYQGREVSVLNNTKIHFIEGISVDKNGKATPIIRNNSDCTPVLVRFKNGTTANTTCDKIQVVFDGIKGFSVTND